ncbi:hypothetical protein BDK51DRAFT_34349 [Blyttiomyces helicus]|uniref:Uncharacterized protein n=1 Tax=Blyttiomyces helicus TaxID=388810 RepID=A0A4P9WQG8_9FUNG|nr:hypothetical protein BDK51DRAFT_34349 [Blyttiomyces helicus]|eukprot:RKO94842.1 hypothetical protein BDK51DRAFT_34349 [Blyttiomyces helicus]
MSSVENQAEVVADQDTVVVPLKVKTTPVKRNFTVISITRDDVDQDFKDGKFSSKTPAGAARKAAYKACKTLYKDDDDCEIKVVIKEVTKGTTSSKLYSYKASRTLATKDVDFKGATSGVKIPFKFAMNLKSLKKDATGNVTETLVTDDITVA